MCVYVCRDTRRRVCEYERLGVSVLRLVRRVREPRVRTETVGLKLIPEPDSKGGDSEGETGPTPGSFTFSTSVILLLRPQFSDEVTPDHNHETPY